MKGIFKNILLTIVIYVLDVIVWGSVLGLLYIIAYGSLNIFLGSDYSLSTAYFKGIVVYWVIDIILAKFRETYQNVTEFKRGNK